ncbi:hypothetical protein EI94DRAFT_1704714 [Lactarius quietus]|nr:hypothetical protein EI94DRAFT_1704714 [Lactarius quietus]
MSGTTRQASSTLTGVCGAYPEHVTGMCFELSNFLDIEADVDDGNEPSEHEDEDEYELDQFFNDDPEEDTDSPNEEGPRDREDRAAKREAAELRIKALDIARRSGHGYKDLGDYIPQHLLGLTPLDLEIWAFRVKVGCKQSLVLQIMNKLMKTGQGIEVSTVFTQDGIIGYVFLEGTLLAAHNTMKTFVTVFKHPPRLVPLDQQKALLTSWNPLSQSIEEGQWVCCHHGLYRGDIGFVYNIDASRDADVVVILIPRIPMKFNRQRTMKRKKPYRPDPRIWTAAQVSSEWGTSVKEESDGKPSDTIKHRWSDSMGIVMTIDEENTKLSYVKDGTGTLVNFNKGGDPAEPWHGRVVYVMDTCATVKEEHTGEEFDLNVHNLDVSSIQGRMLPKTEWDHPLVSCQVMVSRGQLKGYIGLIKDIDNYGLTVELEARLVSGQLPRQWVGWADFTLILKEAVASGSTSQCTRMPLPTTTPVQLTPEPDDECLQWLLSNDLRFVLERRCIPLTVSGVRDGDLAEYEGKVVRTLPLSKHKSTPNPDEVIVSASKRSRVKQMSIEAKNLKPLKPIIDGEVIVIEGPKCGAIGKVGSLTDQICTVRFDDPTGASVSYFKPNKVAYVEALRNT